MGSRGSLVGVLPLKAIARWWVPDPECPLRSLCEEVGSGPSVHVGKWLLQRFRRMGGSLVRGWTPGQGDS